MLKNTSYLIFCFWVFIFTILYYLDIVKYSLLYSSVVAFIFSLFFNIYLIRRNLGSYLSILTVELLVVLVNVKKHFFIDKKKVISYEDIIFNVILFLLYNLFLLVLGTNFFEYYFVNLKKNKEQNK